MRRVIVFLRRALSYWCNCGTFQPLNALLQFPTGLLKHRMTAETGASKYLVLFVWCNNDEPKIIIFLKFYLKPSLLTCSKCMDVCVFAFKKLNSVPVSVLSKT